MPQIQFYDSTPKPQEPTNMEKFFQKLGADYKNDKDRLEIGNILKEYENNSEDVNSYRKAVSQLEKSNISPSRRLEVQDSLSAVEKNLIERDKAINQKAKEFAAGKEKAAKATKEKEEVYELYKPHMPEEEARRLASIDSTATARSKVAKLDKPKASEKPSEFEKTLGREEAKKLVKLEEDIPKARDALANLDRIESLAKNELSGPKGFIKAALGTEAATELQSIGLASIEPILKLFNPVGAIPTQKIQLIQKQFQPKPGELLTTTQGKINALRRMGQQALARAEQRANIIRQHKGKPPEKVLNEFDQQSAQLLDALSDQELFEIKTKGKNDDDLIEGLYGAQNGKKIKPIPKKEAKKLYEQGLITNVPPI